MHSFNSVPVLLADAPSDVSAAYNIGHVFGQLFFFGLIVAGILKCWSISRRPTTNTKCALGLMLLLC